jgi:hypothetical protein
MPPANGLWSLVERFALFELVFFAVGFGLSGFV